MGLLLGAPVPRGDAKPHDTNCNPTTVFNGEEGSSFDWVSQARCISEITNATRWSPWWDLRWLPLLGEGFPKASVHRWMLSATVAVDRVIEVAGFTHPAPRSCLGSLWRYSACTKNDGKAYAEKAPLGEPPGRGTSEDGRRRARPSSLKEQRRSGFRSSRCSWLSRSRSSSHPKWEHGCARPRRRRITRLFSGTGA